MVLVNEQSILENANAKEQVPSAPDQMRGEDVSGQEARDRPGDEDGLTSQERPAHPKPNPDNAAVGAASDAESEQSLLADGDYNLTEVNPPGGVAPCPLRLEEPSTNPDWVSWLRAVRVKKRPTFYSSTDIYEH